MSKHEDYDDYNNAKQTFIVKDEKAALKMKREEARAAREKYKAVVAREREENIALTTPALLVLLIGGFIAMLGFGALPSDQVSVASALLTLVATALMQNLRSIVSEGAADASDANGNGNGHDDEKPKVSKK